MIKAEMDLLDHLDHLVYVVELDEFGDPRYSFVNRLGLRVLGCELTDIVGKTPRQVFPEPLGDETMRLQLMVFMTGEPIRYDIFKPVPGTTTLMPQVGPDGQVVRLVGSSRSVSAPSHVGDPVVEAEARHRDLQNFVHLAAHDLRSPMRQVGSLAEMLAEGTSDPDQLELIEMLGELSNNAMSLIGDILSHAEVTGTSEEISCFAFADLVEQIAGMLDPRRRVEIRADQVDLEMDRAALLVVLRNLIDNAVKYAWDQQHLGRRVMDLKVAQGQGPFLEFTVTDNGRGLDSERLRLFNGEVRCEAGRFGVMGISALLHQRGGWLRAANEPSGGAKISFALPGVVRQSYFKPEESGVRLPF